MKNDPSDIPIQSLADITPRLGEIRKTLADSREMLLANLVMISEIPAPTFSEAQRVRFLVDRFAECGLDRTSTDEVGNGVGVLEGAAEDPTRNILVVAHADTNFDTTDDHTVSMREDRVLGAGVGDNSLGMATLATLPTLLDRLGIELQSNLILLGATRSLGRGDLQGLRFFLENADTPIEAAVCIEGVQLGRLSYASLGMLRGEITVTVPEVYDWTRFGASSAILILNDVINRLMAIPLPRKPRTSILLGSVRGGTSYNTLATSATLRFEIRSESSKIVHNVGDAIRNITDELSAQTAAEVKVDIFAQREPGGVPFGHPLVAATRHIMQHLDIDPHITPSMSELATLIGRSIPAVTLGLTTGENLHTGREMIRIEPVYTGLAQLIGVLMAIDQGVRRAH